MPQIIANRHQNFLIRHVETGKSRILGCDVELFVKHRNGFLIPAIINVRVQANSLIGALFHAEITISKELMDCMLIDDKGNIVDSTRKMRMKFMKYDH